MRLIFGALLSLLVSTGAMAQAAYPTANGGIAGVTVTLCPSPTGVATPCSYSPVPVTATILNAASLSGPIDLLDTRLSGIGMPAVWTAASLTFQVSPDCVTYSDLYDNSGTEYTATAAQGHVVGIPLADMIGVRCLKIRSGTGGSPVAQGADRVLTLMVVR